MNQTIKPQSINFSELVKNSNTTVDLNLQSKIVSLLNEEFTEPQQRLYVANLWMYMNYHPTDDYPINLEDVFHDIGFANKGNAKRTLENNFVLDEDYKLIILPREKKQNAGRCEEKIMLNTETFKSLCMIAKTPQGKDMRKYYVKLENINNKIVKEELKDQLETTQKQLEHKDLEKTLAVEKTLRNSFDKRNIVYLIKVTIDSEIIYKFGYTDDIISRLRTHKNQIGENIELMYCIESKDNKMLEKLLIDYLDQYKFRIKRIINNKTQTELLKVNDIEMIKNKLIELNNTVENDKLLIMKLKNKIIDLENEIINLRKQLLKNGNEIVNDLENKIEALENTILDSKLEQNAVPFIEKQDIVQDRINKKLQVDKIDPTTLQIIETYDCINAIIQKNPDHTYNQVYRSIKSNNVYKDFRWNYTGQDINPTNKIIVIGSKVERIIKLDKNKNFIHIYPTKSEICKLLSISITRLNTIIKEQKSIDDFYYVNESCYENDIPDSVMYEIHNSKKIQETNIETNEMKL